MPQLVLEQFYQVRAEFFDTLIALLWIGHLKLQLVVFLSDLTEDQEGVKVTPDLIDIRRSKNLLAPVQTDVAEVVLLKDRWDELSLPDRESLSYEAG